MKALTILQPWASLIALGYKRFETRSWRPAEAVVGQRIAIHAGKRFIPAGELPAEVVLVLLREQIDYLSLPFGAVIATARLAAVHRIPHVIGGELGARLEPAAWPDELGLGDWRQGRHAWELTNVVESVEPHCCRGAQRLWDWGPAGVCRVCGCTDACACAGGCVWVDEERTLCSNPECLRLDGGGDGE